MINHKYNQMQSMYKAGCRGCDSPEFTRDLCAVSWVKVEEVNIEEYETLMEGYHMQMYPDALGSLLNTYTALVDKREGNEGEKLIGNNDIDMDSAIIDDQNGDSDSDDGSSSAKRSK